MTSIASTGASTCGTDGAAPAPPGTTAPSPRRSLVLLWLAALALPFGGCASCETAPDTGYEHLNVDLTEHMSKVGLGPGDVFELRVYGEETLSGAHRIAPDGSVDVPLVGRVMAEGLTPSAIAERVRDRLKDGFLRDPHVSVYVKEYNSKKVFVLGEVAKPGTFTFTAGMNVIEAVSLAGGFKPSANANNVVVTRRQDGGGDQRIPVPVGRISEGHAPNLVLQPGDIIFVPDKLL